MAAQGLGCSPPLCTPGRSVKKHLEKAGLCPSSSPKQRSFTITFQQHVITFQQHILFWAAPGRQLMATNQLPHCPQDSGHSTSSCGAQGQWASTHPSSTEHLHLPGGHGWLHADIKCCRSEAGSIPHSAAKPAPR